MKAIRIHQFGGPEVLQLDEIPIPEPGPGEVLIKIFATAVNPIDWKIREGKANERFPVQLPLTLGWDVAGEVEALGAGVDNVIKGDAVYGRPDPTKNGAYAEYMVTKAIEIGLKPKTLSYEESAAIPLAGLTAWQALFDHGRLEKGQKVLIHASAGGVGSFAVQFAKWKGAYVVATTSAENIEFIKSLGADEVIDYKKENFEDKVKDIDLVIDPLGGETQKKSLQVLKNGGALITTVAPEYKDDAARQNIRLESFMAKSVASDLSQIASLADQQIIKPVIADVMPFEKAADAHRISEKGHNRGKIVLRVRQ